MSEEGSTPQRRSTPSLWSELSGVSASPSARNTDHTRFPMAGGTCGVQSAHGGPEAEQYADRQQRRPGSPGSRRAGCFDLGLEPNEDTCLQSHSRGSAKPTELGLVVVQESPRRVPVAAQWP
jgi:hypothetical protein